MADVDRLIERENKANFSIEVGREVWDGANRDRSRLSGQNAALRRALRDAMAFIDPGTADYPLWEALLNA